MAEFKEKLAGAQAGSPSQSGPPSKESAGEKAQAGPGEGNEEWIFTLNSQTGEVVKIEKIDPASNQRNELSDGEYAAVLGGGYDPYAEAYSQAGIEQYSFETGYYQGMADYEAALADAAGTGYSPEEEAYYQGIADYAALFG